VVWRSTGSVGSDTSSYSIQGQRFDNAGASLGGQFQVNTYTTDMQWYPSVASDAAGNFVVVWESRGSVGSDTSSYSIQGQRFDNAGASLGGQFQVNTHTPSGQVRPSVASDAAGNFVVAWSGNTSAGSDTSYLSIQARRFDSTGAPQGGDFQVNTYTTSNQYASGVATDSAGKFVVVWDSDGSAGTDTSARSIQGQRFVMPTTSTSTSSTSTSSTSTSSTSTSSSSTSTSSTTLPNQTIAVIDQTGGSLTTPNGRVSINVPPGAVSGPTPFSITTGVSSGYGAGTTSRNLVTVVDLEPEGVTFSPPVTLTFSWPDANNNGRVDRVPPPGDTSLRERNLRVYRNGAVIPGTTICQSQVCAPAACCDMAANTWTVQVSQFSEWAVGTDPCVAVETSKLILKKVLPPSGDDKLTFIGTLTLPGPGTVADQLDVVNDGAVVRLVDGDTIVLDAEIPAGAYDTGTGTGWKVNGTNTKWTYIAPSTGGPGGIKRLKLLDKSATAPGLVKFIAKGSAGTYAAGIGVDPALVLPDAGQCYEATYPQTYPATPSCTATGGGTTIKCK
jgi:hypothetical protein